METESKGPTGILPLPEEGYGSYTYWKKETEASKDKAIQYKTSDWDKNILSYLAKSLSAPVDQDTVVVPRDFSFVEQKIAQLFFQVPEVHLTGRQEASKDSASVFQAVINYYLSEDEVDALAIINEVAFDALCPSGLMCSKIGFETFSEGETSLPTGNMVPDPENEPAPGPSLGQLGPEMLPGSVLGLGAPAPPPPQIPEMGEPVPNIIHQRYFWERISPAMILIPQTFSASKYDKATWLGFRFSEEWESLKKKYKLPQDMAKPGSKGTGTDDENKLKSDKPGTSTPSDSSVEGIEIWYRAAYYDSTVAHPEKFRQLVLLTGYSEPLVHRDSPYQFTSPKGELMGLIGNPIHIGALRYVSDTAFPPSECSISRQTNEELNKGRTQMMRQRDRNMPMRYVDLGRVGGEKGLDKVKENIQQGLLPLSSYDINNPPIGVVSQAAYPPENFKFNEIVDRDLGQIWAMGANQVGQETSGETTATEVSKMDQWASTRLDKERRQILRYFTLGVRKLASLIQQFSTEEELVEVIGADLQPRLQAWDKTTIAGKYAFKINPDSSIRIDQTQSQQRVLKLYELLGKDPNVKRTELLIEVCRQWNLDPAKVINMSPPEKGPDPAAVGLTLKSEDLSVQNPNFPIILAILKEAGYKSLDQPNAQMANMSPIQMAFAVAQFQQTILHSADGGKPPSGGTNPMALMMGPPPGTQPPPGMAPSPVSPPHPGSMPHMEPVNKHVARETGERTGPKPH